MTGLGKGLLLSACGLIIAGAASAAVPNRANSTRPPGITLVGKGVNGRVTGSQLFGGTDIDPRGEFSVTVRDINNVPVGPPATVSVDFGACDPDIRIAADTFGSMTVTGCVVTAPVNALGVATFRIRGGANNSGDSPGAPPLCAVMTANGVFFDNLTVATADQNSQGGVTAGDLGLLISDFFANPAPTPADVGRSDFNFDGVISGTDLGLLIAVFFGDDSDDATVWVPVCP
jgi:hypothetical protein